MFITTGYCWTAGERSVYSDWLMMDELRSVEIIANGYGWTGSVA